MEGNPGAEKMMKVVTLDNHDPRAIALEQEMQWQYVEMYGEPDQDPDNSMYTARKVLALESGDELVGICAWGTWPNGDGKIRLIYVPPAHRRQGFAEMLLRAAEEQMREAGIQRARFESGPDQEPAHRMYDNNGYERLSEGFGYYKDAEGSVFFGKDLG